MDTPSWKKKLAAFVLVGGLAVIVFVALTMFAAGFTSTTPVTVTAQRSGLVMEPDAKVKLRGVEVGRVSSIEHTPDGAVLRLAMQPGQMHLIPSDTRVSIESTTVFGAKFVNLVVPEDPSRVPLQEGAVIAADSVTVEFNTVFEHLSEVLTQVQPEKLNATLGALSEALNGRGDALGATLADADAYLAEINRSLTFGDSDGSGPEASMELAESICGLLDTAAGVAAADAPNDSPITDASVEATIGTMAIDSAFSADTPADAVAVVLRAAGEHLCPEHADTIDAELEHRGL